MKQYLWFDVPVEDFSIVYMLQCQANLHKPIQNLGKRKDSKLTLHSINFHYQHQV